MKGEGILLQEYIHYLEKEGKSEETIKSYKKELQLFIHWLDNNYKTRKELFEITYKDLFLYLNEKEETGTHNNRTLNKLTTIFKRYFYYLWDNGKIPYNPAAKLKTRENKSIKSLKYTYKDLLFIKSQLIASKEWSLLSKTIFILALNGLRYTQFHFKKKDVKDDIAENKAYIYCSNRMLVLEGNDRDVFLEYFYGKSVFNQSDYVFESKKRDNTLISIESMTINQQFKKISNAFNIPKISFIGIRAAYVDYLVNEKDYSTQELANHLGLIHQSAAALIDRTNKQLENPVESKIV